MLQQFKIVCETYGVIINYKKIKNIITEEKEEKTIVKLESENIGKVNSSSIQGQLQQKSKKKAGKMLLSEYGNTPSANLNP